MSSLSAHAAAVFEIGGSTIFLLSMIAASAVWVIRGHVASVFTLLLVFPVALATSMIAYYICQTLSLFNLKNMGEWLVWTVMSGTIGTFMALGLAIAIATITDRPSRSLPVR